MIAFKLAAAAEHHSLRLARLSKVTAASRDGVVQVGDRDYGRLPGSRPGVGVTGTVQGRTTHQLEGHRDSVVNHSEARSTIVAIKVPARKGTANPSPTRSLCHRASHGDWHATGTRLEVRIRVSASAGSRMRMTLASPLAPPGTVTVVTSSPPSAKWGVHINIKYAINRLLHI